MVNHTLPSDEDCSSPSTPIWRWLPYVVAYATAGDTPFGFNRCARRSVLARRRGHTAEASRRVLRFSGVCSPRPVGLVRCRVTARRAWARPFRPESDFALGLSDLQSIAEHDRVPARGDFLDEVAVMPPERALAHDVERGRLLDGNFLLERQPIRLRGVIHLHPPSAPCGQVRLRRMTPENVDAHQHI